LIPHRTGRGLGYGDLQADDPFLTACHYIEENAKRANLVKRAEQWRWPSLWTRRRSGSELKRWAQCRSVSQLRNWLAKVNGSMDGKSLAAVRRSITQYPRKAKRDRCITHSAPDRNKCYHVKLVDDLPYQTGAK